MTSTSSPRSRRLERARAHRPDEPSRRCSDGARLRSRRERVGAPRRGTIDVNERVYIHEFIDVIGHNRAKYMQHMTANWGPDRTGGAQPALLRRVGARRLHRRVAEDREHVGARQLVGTRRIVRRGDGRPRRTRPGTRAVVGEGRGFPQWRHGPHHAAGTLGARRRSAVCRRREGRRLRRTSS